MDCFQLEASAVFYWNTFVILVNNTHLYLKKKKKKKKKKMREERCVEEN